MTLKGIIIFTGGAVCGAVGGWYWTSRKYEKILDELEEKHAEEVKQIYGNPDAFVEVEGNEEEEPEQEIEKMPKSRGSFATDYTSFYKKDDPAEQEHPEDDGEEKVKNKKRLPRIIKAEEFGQKGFTEAYLDYYTMDQALVIADETEAKEIDEVKDWIGDALDKYGFSQNDEEKIYVRNYDRKTDYEILKVWDRFTPPEAYDE